MVPPPEPLPPFCCRLVAAQLGLLFAFPLESSALPGPRQERRQVQGGPPQGVARSRLESRLPRAAVARARLLVASAQTGASVQAGRQADDRTAVLSARGWEWSFDEWRRTLVPSPLVRNALWSRPPVARDRLAVALAERHPPRSSGLLTLFAPAGKVLMPLPQGI